MIIHGNYVNDEFEVEQRYSYLLMLPKSMFIRDKIEWQKFNNGTIY